MHSVSSQLLLGAHLSISRGFEQAIIQGDAIGCGAIQIFTTSNRQWHAKSIEQKEADLFQKTLNDAQYVRIVISHCSYLINLASTNADVRHKSIRALTDEFNRCALLNIPFLVLHPGSGNTNNLAQTLKLVAHGIDTAFEQSANKNSLLLLETMAGQGNSIGHTFEQLAHIYQLTRHKKQLGFCADTCHLFAAGYDISHSSEYKKVWNHFHTTLGLENLHVLRLNDSKKQLNSRVDRHEDIGKGKIGLEAFRLILHDKHFKHIPKILETPKDSIADDVRNLHTLLSLV